MPPVEAIAFLRNRLADWPIRVEWHRLYQALSDVADPKLDLKPECRKLVDETKRSPDAVYLLGRLEDNSAGEGLYLEAARAKPPSAHACAGLSFRYLARGDFDKAVEWAAKSHELNPNDPRYLQRLCGCVARVRQVSGFVASYQHAAGRVGAIFTGETPVLRTSQLGKLGAAERELNRMFGPLVGRPGNPATMQMRAAMDLLLAEVRRDRAKYLEVSARNPVDESLCREHIEGQLQGGRQSRSRCQTDRSWVRSAPGKTTRHSWAFFTSPASRPRTGHSPTHNGIASSKRSTPATAKLVRVPPSPAGPSRLSWRI